MRAHDGDLNESRPPRPSPHAAGGLIVMFNIHASRFGVAPPVTWPHREAQGRKQASFAPPPFSTAGGKDRFCGPPLCLFLAALKHSTPSSSTPLPEHGTRHRGGGGVVLSRMPPAWHCRAASVCDRRQARLGPVHRTHWHRAGRSCRPPPLIPRSHTTAVSGPLVAIDRQARPSRQGHHGTPEPTRMEPARGYGVELTDCNFVSRARGL